MLPVCMPPVLPAPLVLASTSKYRQAQLARLGLPFQSVAPDYAELPVPGVAAGDLPLYHALHKAAAVSRLESQQNAWILAADQGVVWGEGADAMLLGKPHTVAAAVAQLLQLAGRTHLLRTAVVLQVPGIAAFSQVVDVAMTLLPLQEAEAAAYVALDQPLDCAGSYRIEAGAPWILERCEGADPTAIEGLPLLAVTALLRRALADCAG